MPVVLWSWIAGASDTAAPSAIADLIASYEAVRVPLVEDRIDAARDAARELAADASVAVEVKAAAQQVADATEAAAARVAFGELSKAIVIRLEATAVPDGVKVYHCPMAPGYAYWLQEKAGIANPYMGTSMPTCGEGTSFKKAADATGAALQAPRAATP